VWLTMYYRQPSPVPSLVLVAIAQPASLVLASWPTNVLL
jgi:hypothetical protein